MNNRKLFPLILLPACAILVTASIGKSFALYQNMGNSIAVAFEGVFPDLYLRGSFTTPAWAQLNGNKLTDMTNTMSPAFVLVDLIIRIATSSVSLFLFLPKVNSLAMLHLLTKFHVRPAYEQASSQTARR